MSYISEEFKGENTENKPNKILAPLAIINIGVVALLSYVTIVNSSEKEEYSIVYPAINDALYSADFEEVNSLRINIDKDSFSFIALRPKPPEPKDVVGKLVPTDCIGKYEFNGSEIRIIDEITCEDAAVVIDPDQIQDV